MKILVKEFVFNFRARRPPAEKPDVEPELSEAEIAMMAAKKRHQEEEAAKLQSYEEQRRLEREKIDKELSELKEKQELRRKQRQDEEQEFAQHLREEEQRRLKEEAERRAKHEAEARRREEERQKRLEKMGNLTALSGAADGRNFVVSKTSKSKKQAERSQNKRKEITAEEKIASKNAFLAAVRKRKQDVENTSVPDLKQRILALHDQIIRSEAEKYDLEKRLELQEYDLKELTERQRQAARNKALKKGLDPNDAMYSKYPPKISVASKFDRQADRRPFNEVRDFYENQVVSKPPSLARGTARPPPEWGRKTNEELELIRKNLDQPRYIELVKVQNAKPPVEPVPLSLPADD